MLMMPKHNRTEETFSALICIRFKKLLAFLVSSCVTSGVIVGGNVRKEKMARFIGL